MEFGVWSLVPPVLTIALALTTKNVFISLLIGILTGNLVLNHFAVFTGLNAGIYSILDTMTESNTLIIGSVLITAAVIHLAEKSGGIEGFVNVVVKKQGLIKSKRGEPFHLAVRSGGIYFRDLKLYGNRFCCKTCK